MNNPNTPSDPLNILNTAEIVSIVKSEQRKPASDSDLYTQRTVVHYNYLNNA